MKRHFLEIKDKKIKKAVEDFPKIIKQKERTAREKKKISLQFQKLKKYLKPSKIA